MLDEIKVDGVSETDFRRSIETMLRNGCADEAAAKLKAMLAPFARDRGVLPPRFMEVTPADIRLSGWEALADHVGSHDRPDNAITAVGIEMRDPMDVGTKPDDHGLLAPFIETTYFSDSAYPFSEADRQDLLEGYSIFGCEWQGNFERTDQVIAIEGVEDLYGALVQLENYIAAKAEFDVGEITAGVIGSCYLGVLIHQAIRDAVRAQGLPRPLCVLAGGSETYPYFDAPVMTCDEYMADGNVAAMPDGPPPIEFDPEEETDMAEPQEAVDFEDLEDSAEMASLMGVNRGKKKKKPVLIMDDGYSPIASEMIDAQALGAEYKLETMDVPDLPNDAGEDTSGDEFPDTSAPQTDTDDRLEPEFAETDLPVTDGPLDDAVSDESYDSEEPVSGADLLAAFAALPKTSTPDETLDPSLYEAEIPVEAIDKVEEENRAPAAIEAEITAPATDPVRDEHEADVPKPLDIAEPPAQDPEPGYAQADAYAGSNDWNAPAETDSYEESEGEPQPELPSYDEPAYEVVRVARPSREQLEMEAAEAAKSQSFFARVAEGYRIGGIGGALRALMGKS